MSKKMPVMPEENNLLPGEVEASPEVEEKQTYIKPDENIDSKVDVPLVPKKGIPVTATRKGFYGQRRLRSGDKFVVKNFEDLGEWMECEDRGLEKKRREFFRKKKAKK